MIGVTFEQPQLFLPPNTSKFSLLLSPEEDSVALGFPSLPFRMFFSIHGNQTVILKTADIYGRGKNRGFPEHPMDRQSTGTLRLNAFYSGAGSAKLGRASFQASVPRTVALGAVLN